ncbi:MAG TPA: hypothetical protein VFP35_01650 [Candidatus Saccharimonadales bacterium]|nr:hypothetical protein [Candidatus Saccharimonadales bacterium]
MKSKDNKKMAAGLAAMGAVIGTSLLINKLHDTRKSNFDKLVDQFEEWLK